MPYRDRFVKRCEAGRAYLVDLVCLVYLVCLDYLLEPDQPDEPERPDSPHTKRTDLLTILNSHGGVRRALTQSIEASMKSPEYPPFVPSVYNVSFAHVIKGSCLCNTFISVGRG